MSLPAGTRLGHYTIVSAIGAGGMGEVYLAEDARLRRRVALKVLPLHLAVDEAAEKRLLREARAAATLEHPNICTVFEVGEVDSRGFIAMQYVEGNNLADLLKRGPLDLPTALAIARQIADAVAEAHRRGIVHRDIKPQNVVVSPTNHATVLDFGLAKAIQPASGNSPTATVLSEPGATSGTLLYMAPEQARGEAVDDRADIFSFGIVLYEMIAHAHPFGQENWADTLAAILTRDPRRIDVPIPSELRRIIRKCLEKDRSRRYQTMRDVATDLENLAQEMANPAAEDLSPGAPAAPLHPRSARGIWIVAAAIIAVAVGAAAIVVWMNARPSVPAQAGYEAITDFTDSATAPALSRDGRMITFIRGGGAFLTRPGQIYVKMLPNGDPIRLTDDPRPKFGPAFSFDGSRVAYTAIEPTGATGAWDTWTVPISGGPPTRLLANAAGLSWIDARHVMFSEIQPGSQVHMGIVTATEDRREARLIYLPPHERAMAHFSYLSPDRGWVLVVEMGRMGTWESCRLVPFDGSSSGHEVGPPTGCRAAAWSTDGRWMYFAAQVDGASHLWRQRFPDGAVEPLSSGPASEEEGVAVAPDGQSLVTSIGSRHSSLWLRSADGDTLLSSEGYASSPTYSPDGKRLYYLLRRAASGVIELRVMDLASQKSDRLLPDFSVIDYTVSRDETQVAVTAIGSDRSTEIWVASLDRRTAPRRVVQGADNVSFGANRDLVYRSLEGHVNFMTRIGLDGQNRVRISDINAVTLMKASPDGRWITALSPLPNQRFGSVVVPVYGGALKTLCYNGCEPDWSPDGSTLYLGLGIEPPRPVLIVPLQHPHGFPEFPDDEGEATAAWRKLPGARVVEREESIPGLDQSTYVATRFDERRNLFRVPLPR
jgi:eukaryotic-like serine/threonine-protein kinase